MNRILAFLLFVLLTSLPGKAQTPITKGFLDLRNERNLDRALELVGEWEFFWNKHYLPADLIRDDSPKADLYMMVPSYWSDSKDRMPEIEDHGFATYRLRILVPHSLNDNLTLKVPIFDSSYRLFVNGRFINSNGVAGTTPETSLPDYHNYNYIFKSDSDTIDIVVNVSNFHHRRGGFWLPMVLGESEMMEVKQKRNESFGAISTGMLFSFILFFSLFYIMFKDDRTMIYFALATLGIVIRSLVTGSISIQLFLNLSWTGLIRIEYISTFLALVFAIWYFYYVYRDKFMPWVNTVITVLMVLASITVLFTPVTFFSYIMPPYLVLATIVVAHYFIRSIIAAINEEKYKITIAIGFGVLLLGIVNDGFHANSIKLISSGYILHHTMVFFILMQVITILYRWVYVAREEKRLLGEIEYVNRNLESIVIERTSELTNQKGELESQKKETEHKNKELEKTIAIKNRIFSIIAHDLKSPVLNLSLMIEHLKKNNDPETQSKVIESISQQSGFATGLIENLLMWGEGQRNRISYNPYQVNLTDLILENFNLMKETADRKQIKMTYSHKGDPTAICDKDLINIVLRNIISNSIKFTPQYGNISISVEDPTASNGVIHIRIKDNGVGIPADRLDKIFGDEIIDSTPGTDKEKGTGLGLQLCNDLIRINKGSISIASELNRGTTITIMLPAPTLNL
ncbi:MAG: sensor histidine kinase [Bacteroidales bacterium]|nr:sensor histidine kinase [Bacteroidales bacterium]